MQAPQGRSSGFSVVELLIAVAIIGVLAVLLRGSLSQVRQTSIEARCAGNLRALYAAFIQYATDHQGRLPFGAREPDIPEINANYYGGVYGKEFKAYLPHSNRPGVNTGYCEPYLCPGDTVARAGDRGFYGHSYGVNMRICRDQNNRIATWRSPAKAFLLVDSLKDVISHTSPNTNLSDRHRKGANTLFCDGHVEWRPYPFPTQAENRPFWNPGE